LGSQVNNNSDQKIKGGGWDECVIHHWGPIPYTRKVPAFLVYHAPHNLNPLKTSIKRSLQNIRIKINIFPHISRGRGG